MSHLIALIIVPFLLIACKSAPLTTQEKIIQKNDFKIESILQQDTIHSHVLRFDTIINVYNKPVDISTNYDLLSNKWQLDYKPQAPDTTIIYKTEKPMYKWWQALLLVVGIIDGCILLGYFAGKFIKY